MNKIIFIFFISFGIYLTSIVESNSVNIQPSKSKSFSKSKKTLMKIYLNSNQSSTFYCSCKFDSKKNINHATCNYSPRKNTNKRSRKLEWEHVVPAAKFGENLNCWKQKVCTRKGKLYRGRKCCGKVSQIFRLMESDLHNLFPSIGEVNGDRSNYVFGEISGEQRIYGKCDIEITKRTAEPTEKIRGDIARSYFYMMTLYNLSLDGEFLRMLKQWNKIDPPDKWEKQRNLLIEEVQGNRNPFIDDFNLINTERNLSIEQK